MRTILVTGFGPFPRAPFNPTAALVPRLARAARRSGINCVAHVFAPSDGAADRELPALPAPHRPDAIVMSGLAGGRKSLSIEPVARNRRIVWFPDAAGTAPPRPAIALGAPSSR